MPTVLRVSGYRFHFYAFDCEEPRHMHVERAGKRAKYWLDPVEQAWNRGFTPSEVRQIERIIEDHLELLRQKWNEFCEEGGQ